MTVGVETDYMRTETNSGEPVLPARQVSGGRRERGQTEGRPQRYRTAEGSRVSFLEYVLIVVMVLMIISQLGLIENASLLYFYSKWCKITIYPGPTVVHALPENRRSHRHSVYITRYQVQVKRSNSPMRPCWPSVVQPLLWLSSPTIVTTNSSRARSLSHEILLRNLPPRTLRTQQGD